MVYIIAFYMKVVSCQSFDFAQDGEPFDLAHGHERVEWLVEPLFFATGYPDLSGLTTDF